jgi:membrane-associated phospholipid phosphatase
MQLSLTSLRHIFPSMTQDRKHYLKVAFIAYTAWIIAFEAIGRYVATLPTIDITSALDRQIPLVPGWVWIYMCCYFFPFVPLLIARDWHRFNRGLIAIVFANVAAFIVYLAFPVAIPRPALGSSLSEHALAFIYAIDFNPAVTELPSLHVTFSWLVYFMCRHQGLSRIKESLVLSMAILISFSTLFVKQHLIVDVIAGLALATSTWYFAGKVYPLLTKPRVDAPLALRQLTMRLVPFVLVYGVALFLFTRA